jgi:hypothetical protein
MKTGWKIFLGGAGLILIYEAATFLREHAERHWWYDWSRQYCDIEGKPLLTIGIQRHSINPPNGDYTLDIDPKVLTIPGGVHANELDMPFPDKMFGVAYNSHTLEHLNTSADIEKAISECRRVADYAVLLAPSAYSIYANLFCPTHKFRLWLDNENNRIMVKPSEWQTGLGEYYKYSKYSLPHSGGTRQAMLTHEPLPMPAIIRGI